MRAGTAWTAPEVEQLEQLAGDLPRLVAIDRYRRWARRNGFPERTPLAVEAAIHRRGLSLRATGEWITVGLIAETLGVRHDVPDYWVSAGLLPARAVGKGQKKPRYIRRADLVAFARREPARFGGIEVSRLVMLLEDERLAEQIAADHPQRPWHRKALRAVESGRRFATVREAARAMFVTRQALTFALRTGGTCAGFHWEEVA